jgi:EAL domain-containing protein (putative c-di-GMP-specific phosphodiesterase class I)
LVGVNVSAQAIGDRDFHAHVDATLAAAGIARVARLCFEIPEAVAVAQLADTHAFIDILRRRGALAAVDNAGFAPSFAYLKSLRFDLLKLDGRLVRGVADDPVDAAAVRHMVELALATGAQTVAKDVEHPACLKRIRELGVDFAQGFLRHRPEPIDRLAARA